LTQSPDIDELLDQWEDRCESEPGLSADQFIRSFGADLDTGLAKEFVRKASQLAAFENKAHRLLGHADSHQTNSVPNWVESKSQSSQLPSLAEGAEPIDGYRLVSRLGRGGFGDVWRATGPGGFDVALKFVETGGRVGESELRSLETMKGVRHPNLLSVFGAWQLDGMLVIAMELADRTLLDRLDEAKKQGHMGIPMPELLRYMNEAAQGIDSLNNPGSSGRMRIQHRDIKPQNLLLSGGGVKVGDFGLARFLQHGVMGHTGSLTMAYAAPECFDGTTSEHSDQYSLAVTFCQLCCGRLPFDGTPVAIMNGHRTQPPDLSDIPEPHRPAIAKALSKLPKERWQSCSEFVSQLVRQSPLGSPPTAIDASSKPLVARRGLLAACLLFAAILIAGVWRLRPGSYVSESTNRTQSLISATGVPIAENVRPRIAVLYFEDQSSDAQKNRGLSKGLCSMITTGLSNQGGYEVVERERLQAVLDELKLTRADSFDQDDVARIGKLLSADQLLLGSYFEILGTFRIDARLVDVETGVMQNAAGVEGRAEDFSGLVDQLLTKLSVGDEQSVVNQTDIEEQTALHEEAVKGLGDILEAYDRGDRETAFKQLESVRANYPAFEEANALFKKLNSQISDKKETQ
jgi:serine/threonine protein kinase